MPEEILVECPSCGRHVFAHEERCPFCSARRAPTPWIYAAAVAAGLGLSGCDNIKALFTPSANTLYGGNTDVPVGASPKGPFKAKKRQINAFPGASGPDNPSPVEPIPVPADTAPAGPASANAADTPDGGAPPASADEAPGAR